MNRYKQFFSFIFCWLFIVLYADNASSQTLNFKHYTVADGLANSTVYYTLQDKRGFLWIATSSGVNRFDGKNFEFFTTDDGLSDNEVLSLFEDSRGRVWFLTLNGRLSYFLNGKFYNTTNTPLLRQAITTSNFVSCFEDSRKRIWLGTNQHKIICITDLAVRFYTRKSEDNDISNSKLFEDNAGNVLAVNTKGFYRIEGKQFILRPSKFLPLNYKSTVYDLSSRKLLFIAKEGLVEYFNNQFRLVKIIPGNTFKKDLSNFAFNNKKELWLGSVGEGIAHFKKENLSPEKYLPGKMVSHILIDRGQNLWISTLEEGLIFLSKETQNITQYTVSTGLANDAIFSTLKDSTGTLWLGLRNGMINFIRDQKITSLNLNRSHAPFNPISRLEKDPQNQTIWFSSNNSLGQITTSAGQRTVRYLKEINNASFSMKSFSLSRKGKLAFSLASGVYVLPDKNAKLEFESQASSSNQLYFPDRAFRVFYDSKENLWFSNVNGLFRYANNKIDTLAKNSDLFTRRVTDIAELPDGSMAIGTYGYGVIIAKGNKVFKTIKSSDGLASNICRKLAFDGRYIWVTTFSGVSKIRYPNLTVPICTYKIENGLTSNEVNSILVDSPRVYLGTNNGLTILPIADQTIKNAPPEFYFIGFSVNSKKIDPVNIPVLKYFQNNISIQFTAINFNAAKKVLYRYRLKDSAPWVYTYNTYIEFGSLEPGDYNLHLSVKTHDSRWAEPKKIAFSIKPAFWQTTWFILLIFVITSLAIGWIIYEIFKYQRLKEQNKLITQNKIIGLEQRALQAMMNPHFVFNVMNSIQYFINSKDHQAANQVLTGFAKLIRKNLEICTKSYISLEDELSYLKLYLSMEKIRFGEKMHYEINIDPQIDPEEIILPSMLLQPFIENAIWHGLMPKEEGGWIKLSIHLQEDKIYIEILDNGLGIENSMAAKNTEHVSRGMQLTQERINLLNKNNDQPIVMNIRQTGHFGTLVSIQIPT